MTTSMFPSYLRGGIAGVLLATGIFDGPLSLVSAERFIQPAPVVSNGMMVDRTLKGDRLPQRPDPASTIILKGGDTHNAPARASDPTLAPTALEECEPLASPVADPALARLAGRCFV